MKKILIGVAWPYVNGDLHPGHLAGYLLPADIFTRFKRLSGFEVLMVSGSDCFGTPTTLEAEKREITNEEVVSEYHPKRLKLFKDYQIQFSLFTKTTSEIHKKTVQAVFLNLAKDGYLLKAKTKQYFLESEKKFLPDRYVEGECPFCGFVEARGDQCDQCGRVIEEGELRNPKAKLQKVPVILKETEHIFIDWSKFQPILEKYIQTKKGLWRSWIYDEALGWLKKGLRKRAITRDLTWGIPIPNDKLPENLKINNADNKRIYVWFEAVIGYLSATIEYFNESEEWKKYWYGTEALHYYFMGKDNLVFHTLFWPSELYGFDPSIHLPDYPIINNFLNLEGQKFSKSRGITIDLEYLAKAYGSDSIRFYLASIMPEQSDANWSWQDFQNFNNNLLIGKFGNFINRVLKLAEPLLINKDVLIDGNIKAETIKAINLCFSNLENCSFKSYIHAIFAFCDTANKYIADNEPWRLSGVEKQRIIINGLFMVLALLLITKPLIPQANEKITEMLGTDFKSWYKDDVFEDLITKLREIKIQNPKPLFRRIENDEIKKERERLNLKKDS